MLPSPAVFADGPALGFMPSLSGTGAALRNGPWNRPIVAMTPDVAPKDLEMPYGGRVEGFFAPTNLRPQYQPDRAEAVKRLNAINERGLAMDLASVGRPLKYVPRPTM